MGGPMITHRSLLFLSIVWPLSVGLYGLYWFYVTSAEMIRYNGQDDDPFIWLVISFIPVVQLLAIWKHCRALQRMTDGDRKAGSSMLLWILIHPIAVVLTQMELNRRAGPIG